MNLVSVCMITYNHQKYIAQAINSVLMQKTKFDFDIVIGEDCSTDKTREIIQKYKAKYPNKIKLVLQENNVGSYQNFIDSVNSCTGKYIALLEGDDYWIDPYKLQKQFNFLEKYLDYGLVFTAFNVVDANNNLIGKYSYSVTSKNNIFIEMQSSPVVSTLTTMFRRNAIIPLLDRIKKENLWFVLDIWFWQHIALKWEIQYLPEITASYRIHSNSITKTSNSLIHKTELIVIDVYYYFLSNNILPKISFQNKLLISNKLWNSLLSLVISKRGLSYSYPYFKKTLHIVIKHLWLFLGLPNAIYRQIQRILNKISNIFGINT